ncbi:MAG: biosynthetic-type acetolactate synthase large subunit [Thermoguttaceae bacterium]|nr:biosynthetic-type acetolactate synthase large subunit [Thermoguttaceae bacterium]
MTDNPANTNAMNTMTSGADVVVKTLIRCGVTDVFGYPGGATIPLHQAFSRHRDEIRVILPRHEQGGGFAAQGYARATGKVGVCVTTSGPGATNIITAIDDAKLDSVPIVIITGQVNLNAIGADSFQETPITEVCRCITKHHYLVDKTSDLARIVAEAIFVAKSGRPGPVLIDIPKNVLVSQCYPNYDEEFNLPGYEEANPPKLDRKVFDEIVDLINAAKHPMILSGGGVVAADASDRLLKIVEMTGVPVATTMPGLSSFPRDNPNSVGMAGMHGTFCANNALRSCDLLLVFGARFSDRVAAVPEKFAPTAKVVHFDVDPSEFNKVKKVKTTVLGDLKDTLDALIASLETKGVPADLTSWKKQIAEWDKLHPVCYRLAEVEQREDLIIPQIAIEELSKATKDLDVVITTGVGQHQLWTTLFYRFNKPRTWLSSCGLGTMGFGLPAAMGAKVARPEATVIAIEGDGSLQMNIQEMATCVTEHIPVKLLLVNNQHLGNVVQWEDMFFHRNRANTYLGDIDDPENFGKGDGFHLTKRYPDYVAIAKGYGWDAIAVEKRSEYPEALDRMLKSKGPFMIDLRIPYCGHVLPMIPPGCTVDDIETVD